MLAVAMVAVIVTVSVLLTQVGAAVTARHRAQAAADLAALAAAAQLVGGSASACAAAAAVVSTMGGRNAGCATDGLDMVISVEVPVRLGRWGTGRAHASARAGPALGDGTAQ